MQSKNMQIPLCIDGIKRPGGKKKGYACFRHVFFALPAGNSPLFSIYKSASKA